MPGDRGQRGDHRARVQRPLRHRPVGARRHPARHQPAARRAARSSCSATAGPAAASPSARTASGASVIVCEVDPLRALEARMEGFEVMPALRAAERGDVFVTVTGAPRRAARRALRAHEGRRRARQRRALRRRDRPRATCARRPTPCARCARWSSSTCSAGGALNLLAGGRVVNLAAAEGHPAAVMDISFALQALAARGAGARARGAGRAPGAGRDRARGRAAEAGLAAAWRSTSLSDDQATTCRSHRHRLPGDADLRRDRSAMSTVRRLGRPMSSPWWMVTVAGGARAELAQVGAEGRAAAPVAGSSTTPPTGNGLRAWKVVVALAPDKVDRREVKLRA